MKEELWHAIVNNDADYDGKFYYGVMTTGVFCRPSCKSRTPSKENVKVFGSIEDAQRESLRPCKRCKPDEQRMPNEEWVAQIITMIESRYAEPLTLEVLADAFHGSPYHLQRTFKQIQGISPAEYITRTRISKAKEWLTTTTRPIMEIALAVGIANPAHFATQFLKRVGMSPSEYRKSNQIEVTEA